MVVKHDSEKTKLFISVCPIQNLRREGRGRANE